MTDTRFNLAGHLVRAEALRELLVLAENTDVELPAVANWALQPDDVMHQNQSTVAGQLSASTWDHAEQRARVAAWAWAFGGTVVEEPEDSYIHLEAQFFIGETLVYVWAHLRPDNKCSACDGPAVGDQVLKHGEDCAVRAQEESAAAEAQPVTAAVACGKAGRWAVLYTQGGVGKRLPVADRTEARRWIAEHGPKAVRA